MKTTEIIGEILFDNNMPLIKMWNVSVSPGQRPYWKHSHTRFEITVVASGGGEYTVENQVYPMREGDVFVFSSNEEHCITKVSQEGLTITNLHFEPRYLEKSASIGEDSFIELCFSHSDKFKNRIPSSEAEYIRTCHNNIKEEFIKKEKEYSVSIRANLNLLIINLLRHHNYEAHETYDKKSNLKNILSVFDYIDKNFAENLTLNELAEVAGLTPNYLSFLFKKLNGISLWDYITAKRTEKAAALIVSGSAQTFLDIATECGFNNTANFNKAFKKHKGLTPSELKKNPKLLYH